MKKSISIFWRRKKIHYAIPLGKCMKCGKVIYPPMRRCPYCGSEDIKVIRSKGIGTLLNYTISYFRKEGDEASLPRIVGLVRLDEGAIIPAEIVDVDPEEVKEGMRVEAVLRRLSSDDPYGLIYYGLKFSPALNK
ncbi:MAG: Zn-ribbon domain-containing OB-fold protein [Desulfurococcales archaeon]|nr:Zn-ribbon domain-containing OB-fold protein [Desulfurococcales archaeon]